MNGRSILGELAKLPRGLLYTLHTVNHQVRNNCYRASLNTIKRPAYARLYPVTLVRPDGSSIIIKYAEPVAVINLPFDMTTLNENEKKRRLLKRQISGKVDSKQLNENKNIIDKSVKFDHKKYINLVKKK